MDEEFESLVVTDPELVDPGIDISGLRTQTDTSLLGNIPDFAGIQYEAFNPTRLTDLMRLYSSGLPAIDTPAAAVPPATGGGDAGSGDEDQATIPDVDLGGNTPEDQRLIDEGIGLQIAPDDPVVAPGEVPITQAEMDAENFPELSEEMSEVSIPTPPPFEMPRGGGADIDTFDTTPQTEFLPSGAAGGASLENLDLDNIDLGNPTGDPRIVSEEQETQGAPSIVDPIMDPNLMKIRQQQNTITPEDTEESITQKIADFLNVDTDKLNKAAVTSALNLVAGKALDTVIPIATVFNLITDPFTKSPEEIQAEQAAARQNIEENKVLSEILEDEVTPQDIIDDRGRGEIPTRTEPEPTPAFEPPRGGGADASESDFSSGPPSGPGEVSSDAGFSDPSPSRGGGADMGSVDAGIDTSGDFAGKGSGASGPAGGGGDSSPGGKSIVCTAMYQTTGLEDWSKAMKIWYIYQKKYLTIQHQDGYHKLFKPFVKGMHKNNLIKMIGAHVAKHRTQHLKHVMFNSKSSLLGRIYNKILEPICYFVGKHG